MRCNISLPISVSLTNLPTLNSVFIKTNKISDISNMNDTDTEDVDEDMNVNEDIDVDDQVEGDEEDDNKTASRASTAPKTSCCLSQSTTVIESASSVSSGWPSHRPTRGSTASSVPVVTSCHWRL